MNSALKDGRQSLGATVLACEACARRWRTAMNTENRNPRLRRGFAFVALAATLGLCAMGLTQCRVVEEDITGVDLNSSARFGNDSDSDSHGNSACVRACNERYKDCRETAESQHKARRRACDQLSSPSERADCLRAANDQHKADKQACVDAKQICKRNCKYSEGSGGAGR